jgi:hypothetical protein
MLLSARVSGLKSGGGQKGYRQYTVTVEDTILLK